MKRLLLVTVVPFAIACGGGLETPGRDPPRGQEHAAPPASEETTPPRPPSTPPPSTTCQRNQEPENWKHACDFGTAAFVVKGLAIVWTDPASAWKKGAAGTLVVEFRNYSPY